MRIRTPFAGAFLFLLALSAYLGLSKTQLMLINDKALHFIDLFLLTLCFYWVLDTSRRRALNFTLIVCTGLLSIGSEFVQGVIPNGRSFDPYDILANTVGSIAALALCSWYHRRMLERKRQAKHYRVVPGDEGDVELGEGLEHSEALEVNGISRPHEEDNDDGGQVDGWVEDAEEPAVPVENGAQKVPGTMDTNG
ncbi:MAG: hypothetical protein M1816_008206 [Peltula sp. TS41687]|nr:MAG: hypothetical protein M1816_008206 [Peltula sp. TS41687]